MLDPLPEMLASILHELSYRRTRNTKVSYVGQETRHIIFESKPHYLTDGKLILLIWYALRKIYLKRVSRFS